MQLPQLKSTPCGSFKIPDQGVQAACVLLLAALFAADASAQAKANIDIYRVTQVTAPPISGGPPPGAGPGQPRIVPPETGIVPPGSGPRLPSLPAVEPPRGGAGSIQPPPVSPGAAPQPPRVDAVVPAPPPPPRLEAPPPPPPPPPPPEHPVSVARKIRVSTVFQTSLMFMMFFLFIT